MLKDIVEKAVRLVTDYTFHDRKLHRIEAGVMPHNTPVDQGAKM
ncbi:GNAT family N-acetyltransferase [Bacillus nakamurai]